MPGADPRPSDPGRQVVALVAALAVPPAIVVGLLGLLAGPLVALLLIVVVGAAVAAWVVLGADARVRRSFGGRPADPVADARVLNLVDGLTGAAGVRAPEVVVVDDPALNLAVAGTRADRALIVITRGLSTELDRLELEGVLAAAMASVRRGEIGPATVAAGAFGLGAGRVVGPGHDEAMDAGAVGLTRYPPGLASAYEKIAAKGAAPVAPNRATAHLWLVDPAPDGRGTPSSGRQPIAERIAALSDW